MISIIKMESRPLVLCTRDLHYTTRLLVYKGLMVRDWGPYKKFLVNEKAQIAKQASPKINLEYWQFYSCYLQNLIYNKCYF